MTCTLALEYLKSLLSVQMVTAYIIILFIKKYDEQIKEYFKYLTIKLPGGTEISTSQLEKVKSEKSEADKVSSEPQSAAPNIPAQDDTFKKLYESERARSYFWEYSYLNYFLAKTTQRVLDYLASLTAPISISLYDSLLLRIVSDSAERKAIIDALQRHFLITIENDLITVTPKGREYIQWRGKVLNAPTSI